MTTNPNTIVIYGVSDDLVEVDGAFREEYDAGGEDVVLTLKAPNGEELEVTCGFGTKNRGGWHVSVSSFTDTTPSWNMRFVPRPDMLHADPALEIDAPEGTIVEVPEEDEEEW